MKCIHQALVYSFLAFFTSTVVFLSISNIILDAELIGVFEPIQNNIKTKWILLQILKHQDIETKEVWDQSKLGHN